MARAYLSYTIRRAEASDKLGVYAVERASFQDPYSPEMFSDLIAAHRDRFFVASERGKIVGYAVASASATEGHVVSIAVDPQNRRERVGTALLSAVTAKLAEGGVARIRLEVRRGNAAAIAFYKRMGYRAFTEIQRYYADGEDALVLTRSAEPPPPFAIRVGPR